MMPAARFLSGSSRTRRIAATALAVCGLALLGAAPGSTKGSDPVGVVAGPNLPKTVQCGELSVPLDYSRPGGREDHPRVQPVAGFRSGASGRQPDRQPGRPRHRGERTVAAGSHRPGPAAAPRCTSASILIGMDPRGTGLSTPIKCDPAVFNRPVNLFPSTKAEFEQVSAWSEALGAELPASAPGRCWPTWTRGSVARDMEQLRQALGDGKLNFLGLSYGAHLGSTYAELYPKRVRTMALDAIANHSALAEHAVLRLRGRLRGHVRPGSPPGARRRQRAPCTAATSPRYSMPSSPAPDQQPIPAPALARTARVAPTVTGGEIRMNRVSTGSWSRRECPPLASRAGRSSRARSLRAEQGDAQRVLRAASPRVRKASRLPAWRSTASTIRSGTRSSRLRQLLWPRLSSAGCSRRTRRARARPGWACSACMRWPVPPPTRRTSLAVHGAPPILLVAATHDPSTPYVWAHEMRDRIPKAQSCSRETVTGTSRRGSAAAARATRSRAT